MIGRPDLTEDERFADQKLRAVNYYELKDELESALAERTAAQWVDALHEKGLMATLAYNWKQVVHTPLFAENELAVTVGEGENAQVVVRTPARFDSFTPAAVGVPPSPGEHNDEFLASAVAN